MTEEEANEYWKAIDKKADSIIEILKGISYQEAKQLLITVNSKINHKIESTVI